MKRALLILSTAIFLLSCFPFSFPPEPRTNFEDIYIAIQNNAPELECTSKDTLHLEFVLKNINNDTIPELKLTVPFGTSKYVNMKAKFGETLSVNVFRAGEKELLDAQKVKVTEVKISGGDPASRQVNYCKEKGLFFKYF